MKSMTGFGTGNAPLGDGRVIVEARSVNHRFLDVRVRLPQEMVDQSLFLEQRARKRLSRGRFEITVRYEGPAPAARLDFDRARALYRELERLRDELSPGSVIPFATLLGIPALYSAHAAFEPTAVQAALGAALDAAASGLDAMRELEGAALEAELRGRLAACRRLHGLVQRRLPEAVSTYEGRLRARISRLTSDTGVALEPGRLEAEVALLVDRTDVAEELMRLESHYRQLEGLLSETEPSGRRLDFLLQEMARESNTIGSKSQDAQLSHAVVELKSEIERMREQVQNVE